MQIEDGWLTEPERKVPLRSASGFDCVVALKRPQ
jgi:hypothetical protein